MAASCWLHAAFCLLGSCGRALQSLGHCLCRETGSQAKNQQKRPTSHQPSGTYTGAQHCCQCIPDVQLLRPDHKGFIWGNQIVRFSWPGQQWTEMCNSATYSELWFTLACGPSSCIAVRAHPSSARHKNTGIYHHHQQQQQPSHCYYPSRGTKRKRGWLEI